MDALSGRGSLLLSLLLWAGTGGAAQAQAQAQDTGAQTQPAVSEEVTAQARGAFQAGVAAFDAGQHAAALAHFERAQTLKPHPMVRVNIANCHAELGHAIEALTHFEAFLASDFGAPGQRREVRREIDKLQQKVGNAQLLISPAGASVRVDGTGAMTAPLAGPLRMLPGQHEIDVSLEGYAPYTGRFNVRGGRQVTVQIALQPMQAPPALAVTPLRPDPSVQAPPPVAPVAPADPSPFTGPDAEAAEGPEVVETRGLSGASWVAMVGTGVLLAGTVVTGIAALAADGDFRTNADLAADPNQTPATRQQAWEFGRDALDTADTLALTSDVLLVGALLGGCLSGYLIHRDLSGEPADEHAGARLRTVAGPDGAGLVLSGKF